MIPLGLCASTRHYPDAAELAALGIGAGDWLRLHVYSFAELDAALRVIPPDINIFMAPNNEMVEVGWDWIGWESVMHRIATYYAHRVKMVGCGNELDLWHLQSPSGENDTRLTPLFAANLVRRAGRILRPAGIKVALSSVASGSWPAYLREMSHLAGAFADYADLHLYAKQINGVPGGWQTADDALRSAAEIAGRPVIASEAGIKVDDAGGEDAQARWAEGLRSLPAQLVCYFAWRDDLGTGEEQGGQAFGARGVDGRAKPVWFTLQRLFAGQASHPPAEQHAIFQLGFKTFHDAAPDLIGEALENERGGIPGFSQQKTSRGILTAAEIKGRGWEMLFWESDSGTRYWFRRGKAEVIA